MPIPNASIHKFRGKPSGGGITIAHPVPEIARCVNNVGAVPSLGTKFNTPFVKSALPTTFANISVGGSLNKKAFAPLGGVTFGGKKKKEKNIKLKL